jgi:hypothetical protein
MKFWKKNRAWMGRLNSYILISFCSCKLGMIAYYLIIPYPGATPYPTPTLVRFKKSHRIVQ